MCVGQDVLAYPLHSGVRVGGPPRGILRERRRAGTDGGGPTLALRLRAGNGYTVGMVMLPSRHYVIAGPCLLGAGRPVGLGLCMRQWRPTAAVL